MIQYEDVLNTPTYFIAIVYIENLCFVLTDNINKYKELQLCRAEYQYRH